MSLRDWFAGMALQGMLASQQKLPSEDKENMRKLSELAYQIADEMAKQQAFNA